MKFISVEGLCLPKKKKREKLRWGNIYTVNLFHKTMDSEHCIDIYRYSNYLKNLLTSFLLKEEFFFIWNLILLRTKKTITEWIFDGKTECSPKVISEWSTELVLYYFRKNLVNFLRRMNEILSLLINQISFKKRLNLKTLWCLVGASLGIPSPRSTKLMDWRARKRIF